MPDYQREEQKKIRKRLGMIDDDDEDFRICGGRILRFPEDEND